MSRRAHRPVRSTAPRTGTPKPSTQRTAACGAPLNDAPRVTLDPAATALATAAARCVADPASTVGVPLLLAADLCTMVALVTDGEHLFPHRYGARAHMALHRYMLERFRAAERWLEEPGEIGEILELYRAPKADGALAVLPPAAVAVLLGGSAWSVPGAEHLAQFLGRRAPRLPAATLLTASLARLRAPDATLPLLEDCNTAVATALADYVRPRFGVRDWESATYESARRWDLHAARELATLAAEALAYHGASMVLGAQRETAPVTTEPFFKPGEAVAFALETAQALTAETGFVPGLTDRTVMREALTHALGGAPQPSVGTTSHPRDRAHDLLH